MINALKCIMLIDDDDDDNFIHERAIKKNNGANVVVAVKSGKEALEYLKQMKDPPTDLIFLDINMPTMNGWEFLQEYEKLNTELRGRVIILMLTTSGNADDMIKAKKWDFVSDFVTKPLTKDKMHEIAEKYFNKH